jgi:F-type H+-transporting ATPase subunit a
MEKMAPLFEIRMFNIAVPITYSVVAQWVVMVLIMLAVLLLTVKIEKVPRGRQVWVEYIVEKIDGLVKENMGKENQSFTPFIGTLMIYLLVLNLTGLFGFKPPTSDYSVALGLAAISFVIIHSTSIKKQGVVHYLAGYAKPIGIMLPLNIIERAFQPISLSLRLFGNITASYILVDLIYQGLDNLSRSINIGIPVFQTLIPIPFHIYFDIFDGAIQMFIFAMLTMIFTKVTSEH